MQRDKNKNMAMIAVAAVILIAANAGLWMAVHGGTVDPAGNPILWMGFMALNVVSILWAISLLGLQPLVVAASYLGGGFLAFKGAQGLGGVSMAELTAAGATYGAFGALAAGNVTTRVRFAFYNKLQVPFIFIIIALLALDGILNSGVLHAGTSVFVRAMAMPFVLVGVVAGGGWSLISRMVAEHKSGKPVHEVEAHAEAAAEAAEAVADLLVSEHAAPEAEEAEVVLPAAAVSEQPEAPAAVEEIAASAVEPEEEAFFPLEIDKADAIVLSQEDYELAATLGEDDAFAVNGFDSSLYASGAMDDAKGVMVDEPVAVDLDQAVASESEKTVAAEPKPKAKSEDWLNGHLELLSRLK